MDTAISPSPLEVRRIGYRVFYQYMARKGYLIDSGRRFYISLIREDMCLKMMFKTEVIFKRAVEEMLENTWLTRDDKGYKLGVKP